MVTTRIYIGNLEKGEYSMIDINKIDFTKLDIRKITPHQNEYLKKAIPKLPIAKQIEIRKILMPQLEACKEANPFKYWKPNDGVITPERRKLLERWLKPEDIPIKTDSQLEVILSDANEKAVSGGNRSGKTVSGTISGIIKSTGELPLSLEPYKDRLKPILDRARKRHVNGRVTAVDDKQLHRVLIPIWQKYVPREFLKKGNWSDSYSSQHDILSLYRNNKVCAKVEFLTNKQDTKSAQGGDLDWAVFDEEPDSDKYGETLMRFGTADRLDIEIDWTPTEGITWSANRFHLHEVDEFDTSASKIELFKLTPATNPYVNPDTLIKIMDSFAAISTYDEMKMRLLGEAVSLSGLVYGGLFNKRIHVIPPFKLDYKNHIVYRGLDPHLVKPTVCVEVAVDKEGIEYVVGTYSKQADTSEIKRDLAIRAKEKGYRLGWTRCDKSANSTIKVLGDRNVFLELSRGEYAIPALDTSEKYTGSIHAGVDLIKQKLKHNPPLLYIFDIPENKELIKSFQSLERDTYNNEDKRGQKDRINEGKHDAHAALRYVHQRVANWMPPYENKPVYEEEVAYI